MNTIQTETKEPVGLIAGRGYIFQFKGQPWKANDSPCIGVDLVNCPRRQSPRTIRRSKRYYEFAEAVKIAKRAGWDALLV